MPSTAKRYLKNILHPYLFILKEGKEIKTDFLDYSLSILLVNSLETIKSPSPQSIQPDLIAATEINLIMKPTILGDNPKTDNPKT